MSRSHTAQSAFGGVVCQAHASVAQELGEDRPVVWRQQIVDDLGMFGQGFAFALQPAVVIFDQEGRRALSGIQPISGGKSAEVALDIKQGIAAAKGLEGDGGDFLICLAVSNVALDIGQFEECGGRGSSMAQR